LPNSDWKVRRISDLGEVITGTTPPTRNPEYFGDGYPFVTPSDLSYSKRRVTTKRYLSDKGFSRFHRKALPANSVCYTCIASIGKMCLTKETSFTNQQINSIIVNAENNPLFVYYLLLGNRDRINMRASGVAAPIINKSTFSSIEVVVPPKNPQDKIAYVLSSFDDLIEVYADRTKILKEIAEILYQEWFSNFRYPHYENTEIINSPHGPTPKGWKFEKLGNVCEYISRGISPEYDENAECLVINQRCIRNRQINIDLARRNLKRVNPKKYVRFGDVLINSTGVGTLGRVAQVYSDIKCCTVDSHVTILRTTKTKYDYLGSTIFDMEDYLSSLGVGATGQTELNKSTLSGIEILTPPIEIQQKFSNLIRPIRLLIENLSRKSKVLRQKRDLVLPKLISGEIEVNKLDIDALSG